MLANSTTEKLKQGSEVRARIVPELISELNHLPNSWRIYFANFSADGAWTESSTFGQTEVRGQASFWFRDWMATSNLADTWQAWRERDPAAAAKAFEELGNASFKWILRLEWFQSRVIKFQADWTTQEEAAKAAAEKSRDAKTGDAPRGEPHAKPKPL